MLKNERGKCARAKGTLPQRARQHNTIVLQLEALARVARTDGEERSASGTRATEAWLAQWKIGSKPGLERAAWASHASVLYTIYCIDPLTIDSILC